MYKYIRTTAQLLGSLKSCRFPMQAKVFQSTLSPGFYGKDDLSTHPGMARDKRFANDYANVLSFYSLRKARRILALTSSPYMYFHNLKPKDFVKYMDVLIYIESLIYLIDGENEGSDSSEKFKFDFSNLYTISEKEFSGNINGNRRLSILQEFLKNHKFYDDRIHRLLHDALLYNKLEQWCMRCISDKKYIRDLDEYAVQKMHSLRAYDTRIQNVVLYQLTNQPYNQQDMDFMRNYEIIYDNLDDLCSYEKDVVANTFNTYRMYAKMYPNSDLCQAKFTQYILGCRRDNLSVYDYIKLKHPHTTIQPDESDMFKPAFKETESGDIVLSDLWVFPELIADEEEFTKKHHSQAK